MALTKATMQYLQDQGLVHDDRVDRHELTVRFADALRAAPCNDLDQVEAVSKTVSEWRSQVLGDPDNPVAVIELNQLAGQLLAIGASGPVQHELEDGVVLCKTTVHRLGDDGELHEKRGRGRVISSNADIVERFHDAVKAAELIRKGQATRKSFDLSGRRVPELAARHTRMLGRTSEEIEQLLLLPAEAGS